MALAQEAEHGPGRTQGRIQIAQCGQRQAVRPKLPSREAHTALDAFQPQELSATAFLVHSFTRKSEALSDRIRGKHVGPGQDFSRCRCPAGISTVERGARHGWSKFGLDGFRLRHRRSGLHLRRAKPFYNAEARSALARGRLEPQGERPPCACSGASAAGNRGEDPPSLFGRKAVRNLDAAKPAAGGPGRTRSVNPGLTSCASVGCGGHIANIGRDGRLVKFVNKPLRNAVLPTYVVDAMVIARSRSAEKASFRLLGRLVSYAPRSVFGGYRPSFPAGLAGTELRAPDVAAHRGEAAMAGVPHDLLVRHEVPIRGRDEAGAKAVRRHRLRQGALDPGQRRALEQDLPDRIGMQPGRGDRP